MTSSSDTFPFGIADVVELLGLTVRRRLPSSLYLNCPFCGDLRGRLNVNTDKNVWRCNRCGAAGGMLALYARYNCTGNADAYREICEALGRYTPRPRVNDCIGVKPEQNIRATPQEIHQTYSLLLSMLPLTPTHKAHLLSPRRGLTEEQIARFGFKSTPPAFLCRSYAERLRRHGCTLQGVPGFYQDDAGRWTINFGSRTAGILLPAVGMDGLICGMQIRLDTPLRRRDDPPGKSGAKYIWLSSIGKPHGVTSSRETCQVIQKISDEELLIRIFKVRWAYKEKKNTPAKEIYENARLFIHVVGKEGTDTEAFYYDSSYDSTTHWRRGNRPRFSPYTSGYEADDTGAIYLPSLKRALQGTPWQYCALRQFYEPTKEAMQVSTYLRVYRRHPKLIEHLVKVGFERIVSDIVYRHGMGAEIDDTQKRTHRILRVNKEDLTMLRELNAGIDTLRAYQQYTKLNLRSRQELLQWQLKNHVHTVPTQWFAYMTARKFMRYMDSQLPDYMQLKRAFLYRSPMEEAISTYSDYLQMCQEQNYDMKSSQVLFPKHCNEAHDELSRYIKKCRDEQTKRAFREVYEHLAEKANLTSKKLQIVCPKQTDDLIAEGQALHHCVGTYIERVAAKKCLIVFVRRVEEPKKPYVTVEVRNGKIEQIHGDHNSDPTEEVKKFVDLWSRKVLPMALQAA